MKIKKQRSEAAKVVKEFNKKNRYDVLGMYTGTALDGDTPTQDTDDL